MSYIVTNDDYKPSLTDEDELAHYGIKGMKWGVRRSEAQLARARGESTTQTAKKKVVDTAKKVKKMSDARDSRIQDARDNVPTKKAEFKTAKKTYKADKKEMGRKAAKEILKPVKNEYISTLQTAQQKKAAEIALGLVLDQVRNHVLRDIETRKAETDFNIRKSNSDANRRREQQSAQIERNRRRARA